MLKDIYYTFIFLFFKNYTKNNFFLFYVFLIIIYLHIPFFLFIEILEKISGNTKHKRFYKKGYSQLVYFMFAVGVVYLWL